MKAFFLWLMKLFGLVKEEPPVVPDSWRPPVTPVNSTGVIAGPAVIDYARYGGYTPFEIQTRIFPSGVPLGWDWSMWAKVNGKPDPRTHDASGSPIVTQGPVDRRGFDLGDSQAVGRVFVNQVAARVPVTFTFNRRRRNADDRRPAVIKVFGAPGAFFTSFTDSIDGAAARDWQVIAGTLGFDRDVTDVPDGPHTYTVAVDGSGQLGVQFVQQEA